MRGGERKDEGKGVEGRGGEGREKMRGKEGIEKMREGEGCTEGDFNIIQITVMHSNMHTHTCTHPHVLTRMYSRTHI